ncbi:ADP-ribosylation factor 3 [Trypanosoma rangeli]|uniref:ADP-ribosylation factor 3 n=1 Tax=Trypanosoma rangeli TaxID=5698 RepID=A0A3R7RGT1_TRYRA|nr:ADP-ribosylation factor 3 [Trypanosoma rangeli]RNF02398.1 ADP-ribosylation factor 3 [Trypanosoma rangeli]|eukprot:RNF02398.1 ADP-ribosylation factor 3 [Trypanosoma rangeli]
MGLLDLFFRLKPFHRDRSILIIGLDNAGKTCIFKKLSDDDTLNTMQTQGFNIKILAVGRLKLSVWDIGGQKSIRQYWRYYFGDMDALIFVIDAFDMQRVEEAKLELYHILEEEKLAGVPLLLFANKQDILGAVTAEDLITVLQLNEVQGRKWRVQSCSAKTGEGLDVGVAWVVEQLRCNAPLR